MKSICHYQADRWYRPVGKKKRRQNIAIVDPESNIKFV
jgi:hypothetical protein